MKSASFECDDAKAQLNRQKHGVSFEKASAVFDDPFSMTFKDFDHSEAEQREITFGSTMFNEVLVVAHTQRDDRIRIISARHATKAERRKYMSKKSDEIRDEDDLRPEYDFDPALGVRGKYYDPERALSILIKLDRDVVRHYSTPEQVNDALRQLIAEGRAPAPRNE